MTHRSIRTISGFAAMFIVPGAVWLAVPGLGQEPPNQEPVIAPAPHAPVAAPEAPAAAPPRMRTAVAEPKPLSDHVKRGVQWLLQHQSEDGGWGQGEESAEMGNAMAAVAEKSNVADTCAAALTLIRAGGSPKDGPWSTAIHRGLGFVFKQIEASDADSLSITSITGTRVQTKLGQHIDTFMASLLMAEVKGKMPDEEAEQRLAGATKKVLHKLEVNQKNGVWENSGWAPALAQSVAAKGLNRASQVGTPVTNQMLVDNAQARQIAVASGGALGADGDAGIALYAGAANLSTLQDNVNTNEQRRKELEQTATTAPDERQREKAKRELGRIDALKMACSDVQKTILQRLDDPQFLAGFGSNGGEEFISYLNIGESLVVKGDADWSTWDREITANMNRIQNSDGSWTGHHCITGRTFCTATALQVLMVDRTPVPVEVTKPTE